MKVFSSGLFRVLIIFGLAFSVETALKSQDCIGGQIYSNEAHLYGRFEVAMRSAGGEGIVSSFFLYNLDVGCNWPVENNEIDIEMTGNNDVLYFTTHYPNLAYYSDTLTPDFSPHNEMHTYAIEWEPDIVRWFVDGELVNVQDQEYVTGLIYPLRIMMNLWAANATGWVGVWDPSIMPVESEYEWVRYYAYDPESGNSGTDNHFTLAWEEQFDDYNQERWTIEEWGGFDGNYCTFKFGGVTIESGKLFLQMVEQPTVEESIPVTFSVDVSKAGFQSGDLVYLNGSFNDWCGNCALMTENEGVWTKTIDLLPGEYEYVFTKNFWEDNGSPPLGSECDYHPCDEWANYGFIVSAGDAPIILDAPCWDECSACLTSGIESIDKGSARKIIGIYDLIGRPVIETNGKLLIYRYSDGRLEKKIKFD